MHSTRATIQKKLHTEQDLRTRALRPNINFRMKDAARVVIEKANVMDIIPADAVVSIDELGKTLNQVNEKLNATKLADRDRVALEHYKTAIMDTIVVHLKQLDGYEKKKKEVEQASKFARFLYWAKIGFLGLISLVGMVDNGIYIFIGMRELILALIPGIPNPLMICLSLAIVAVNTIQFFAFEIGLLKDMLGVKTMLGSVAIVKAHDKQVALTHEMNIALTNVNVLGGLHKDEYASFKSVAVKCNEDIEKKKTLYTEYKESKLKIALRWLMGAFGGIMVVAGSYFATVSLLTVIAAPLLGTPAGWVIISALMISAVVLYFATQNSGVKSLLNPAFEAFNTLKDKLTKFTTKNAMDFDKVLANENVFKRDDSPEVTPGINMAPTPDPSPVKRTAASLKVKVINFFTRDSVKRNSNAGEVQLEGASLK